MNQPPLIVSAWKPEIQSLMRHLQRHCGAKPNVVTGIVGVGMVEAAAQTTRLLSIHTPSRIILIGSAGVYPDAWADTPLPLGQAFVAASISTASGAEVWGQAYVPTRQRTRVSPQARLSAQIAKAAGLKRAGVLCTPAITASKKLARALASNEAPLENLEAFAVARAAQIAKIPFAAVLGVSNAVGPKAHAQWETYGPAATNAACEAVARWRAKFS